MDLPPAVVAAAMEQAIALARSAAVPFGAVLLDLDSRLVVARSANEAGGGDLTAHAETGVLREATAAAVDLTRCALVSTAEPCPMCAVAAVFADVAGVYYGSAISTLIKYGWPQFDIPIREVVARVVPGPARLTLLGGVLAQECDRLYADSAHYLRLLTDHAIGKYHAADETALVDSADIDERLQTLPNWWLRDGRLHRSFHCGTFEQSMQLVNQMAELAQQLNHHPEFQVERKRSVHVTLRTHKLGTLTTLDFDLATEIEAAYHRLSKEQK
jgi:pterin-4a-carbinolamine dehydratase/tRNA(Arg) A34 adenosine deaminase TadA